MPNRKDLLKNSMIKKDKAASLKGVQFIRFDGNDIFVFSIHSASRLYTFHRIKLQLVDLQKIIKNTLTHEDDIRDINLIKDVLAYAFTQKVRVFCSCEDFLYSGSKYWNYKNDSGIEEETRPPQEWKLAKKSLLCKHIRYILLNISRYFKTMAQAVSKSLIEKEKNKKKNK